MTNCVAQVTKVALELPLRSRAKLAEKLLKSLDPAKSGEMDALWAAEAESRIDAFERGELKAVDGKTVLRRLKRSVR